jgi:thiol-disulfide isomerase/thioredoxin
MRFAWLALLAACGTQQPGKLELVAAAATGEVAPLVSAELARAKHDGKKLLVYVGASWCEPCRRFHEAAQAGKLDRAFPTLRALEFDHDRDHDRLAAAGYTSRLIPLFALPGADGRASGRQIEGSIKGDAAVEQIAPRLRTLLE